MAHSKEEISRMINVDEPDYPTLVKQLSKDDIPVLAQLSKDEDTALAAKAISCLRFFPSTMSFSAIKDATKHQDPIIRIAAAQALGGMPDIQDGVSLLGSLLDDSDTGVRKFALKSVEFANIKSLSDKVSSLKEFEKNPGIKHLATSVLKSLQQ